MIHPLQELLKDVVLSDYGDFPAGRGIKYVLGSNSMSRKAILDHFRIDYTVFSPKIDEKAVRAEDPMRLPLVVAEAKLGKVIESFVSNVLYNPNLFPQGQDGPLQLQPQTQFAKHRFDLKKHKADFYRHVSSYEHFSIMEGAQIDGPIEASPGFFEFLDRVACLEGLMDGDATYRENLEVIRTTRPVLIASDQIIVSFVDGEPVVREKPESPLDIREFYRHHSRGKILLVSGLLVFCPKTSKIEKMISTSEIEFLEIPECFIAKLASLPTSHDIYYCAGAIMIENPEIAKHIRSRSEDVTSILGLPMHALKFLVNSCISFTKASTSTPPSTLFDF